MSNIFKKALKNILIVLIFLTVIILSLVSFQLPKSFLSKTQRVKSNMLIVEGWLPPYAIDMACKEFQNNKYDFIITTGFKYSAFDFCMVASNGYLIFYPQIKPDSILDSGNHTIEVVAFSELDGLNCAHFNFFVNDSIVGDFKAAKKVRKYGISWNGKLEDIDSLIIQFDNDLWDDAGDRNLYVKEIIIDNKIKIPYQFNSELDIGSLDGKERITKYTYFDSSAEFCRNQLLSCGIDSDLIIAVPGSKVYINRTLTSVFAIRNWLISTDRTVTGINIISLGIHSRRTWMTYHKILGKTYNIGIISVPESAKPEFNFRNIFKLSNEIFGTLYYWLILTFIHT